MISADEQPTTAPAVMWSDEVQDRLKRWGNWTRGNQLVVGTKNVLAEMIKRAAGEVPGCDLSIGYEFTIELEATDKAVARMRVAAEVQAPRTKRHIKSAKRVLMSTYLGHRGIAEIALNMNCSQDHVKALLWYAESYVGRILPDIEAKLQARQKVKYRA